MLKCHSTALVRRKGEIVHEVNVTSTVEIETIYDKVLTVLLVTFVDFNICL